MYLSNYEIEHKNTSRMYRIGNGFYDEMDYSGYQCRGDGHGIGKNYRVGYGDILKVNHNNNLIFNYEKHL